MNTRAYSVLEIKAFDEDARTITGIATTPKTDRMGDIVEPEGAEYELPLPLLWQHRGDSPIGHVTAAKVTKRGIEITAQLQATDEPGELKNLLDKAWQSLKLGLVRGLSIGFRPIESTDIQGSWAQRYVRWEWLELSVVTIPANAEATIATVKAYDEGAAAATGQGAPAAGTRPGASGKVKALRTPLPEGGKMTITEQIRQFEATRQAKDARRTELMQKAAAEGTTLDAAEEEEYDTLTSEIEAVDKHLLRLRTLEKSNKAAAAPAAGETAAAASAARGAGAAVPVVTVRPNVAKGISFARHAMAIAACKGNRYEAAEFAKARWGDAAADVVSLIKAPVAAGTTTDATWAAPLVQTQTLVNEFLELLRPATVLGRIQGLRRVPFNVAMPRQTAGGTYSWVGQGAAKPVTSAAFDTVTLGMAKAAGIIVLAEELVRSSAPSAEEVVRDEMIAGMAAYLDAQFTDPLVAAVPNVSPASITNGVVGFAASGNTEAAARADLRALIATFAGGNYSLSGLVLLMSESVAFTLGTMVNAVGEPAFPGISVTGGSILGIPVVVSNTIGDQIIAAHASSILFADEGGVEIDISREASLQMDSAPDNPTTDLTVMVSLWQRNLVGLRAERFINWAKARATAVNRIHTVAYA